MEFKEYSNPESKDYDIKCSFEETSTNSLPSNPYIKQLIDLVGFLEDVSEEELQQKYGISMNEYFNPTAETIHKISQVINSQESITHKQRGL